MLNWNDGDTTLACLRALARTRYDRLTTIVVDNGSHDGSADRIAAEMPAVRLVRNPVNLGFTGGVNTGIRAAMDLGADFVWLLNSDALTGPDVLARLVDVAQADPAIGLVSPVFNDPDAPDRLEFCLGRFDPRSRVADQTTDPAVAARWMAQEPDRVLLIGTALLVSRRLIETIGMLDDRFFAYVEDVDYSLRSTAAGFRNVAVPDAVVGHKFKEPVQRPDSVPPYLHYLITRNYLLLWRKLGGPFLFSRAMLWFVRARLLQMARMPDQHAAIEALLAGLWEGWLGRGGPYRPKARMPRPLAALLRWCPRGWVCLLDGRLPTRAARQAITR